VNLIRIALDTDLYSLLNLAGKRFHLVALLAANSANYRLDL
jgi:hypothetical protein